MKLLNLASNNSFWRGIDYHHQNRIIDWKELTDNCFQGKVRGSGGAVYDEREEEIREYVRKLSKAELREKLIQRMVDDLYY